MELMLNASMDDPSTVQTALSAAVDFATAGTSSDPVRDGIAQLLSLVQDLKASVLRPPEAGAFPGAVAARKAFPQHVIYRKESARKLAKGPDGQSSSLLFYPDLAAIEMTEFYGESGGGSLDHGISLYLTVSGLRMDRATEDWQEMQIQLNFNPAAAHQLAAYLTELANWADGRQSRRGF
jgi:hypothetical protein